MKHAKTNNACIVANSIRAHSQNHYLVSSSEATNISARHLVHFCCAAKDLGTNNYARTRVYRATSHFVGTYTTCVFNAERPRIAQTRRCKDLGNALSVIVAFPLEWPAHGNSTLHFTAAQHSCVFAIMRNARSPITKIMLLRWGHLCGVQAEAANPYRVRYHSTHLPTHE